MLMDTIFAIGFVVFLFVAVAHIGYAFVVHDAQRKASQAKQNTKPDETR